MRTRTSADSQKQLRFPDGQYQRGRGQVETVVYDDLWEQVLRFVRASKRVETTMLMRNFHVGYTHAKDLMQELKDKGIISDDGNLIRQS
jgi:DNA segregation ATPase FtsK/SpoIIIE-like protein